MPRRLRAHPWLALFSWLAPALAAGQAAELPAAPERRLESQDGAVRLRLGDQIVWETPLTPHLRGDSARPTLRGPLPLEDRLVLCLGSQLYELSAADGRVLRRQGLPGPCAELAATAEGVRLVCEPAAGDSTLRWRFERVLAHPDQPLPYTAFPAITGAAWTRVQSRLVPDFGADQVARRARLETDPLLREAVAAAVPALQSLAAQDPTNPWYHFTRGEYLELLDRPAEAAQAFRQALTADPRYDHDLLPMAEALGRLDPALGEEAHLRGLRFLLTHGFEPELAHGLVVSVLLLGKPAAGARLSRDELRERARRLIDVTPLVEGATGFYLALAAASKGEEAGRFQALAAEARPYRFFGPSDANTDMPWTGVWLQGLMACLLAVLVAGVVKTLRSLSTRFKPPVGTLLRLNPMARWSRGEQLAVIAVLGVGLWCGSQAARGIALIGVRAAVPLSLLSGQLQHPEAAAYLASLPPRPGVVFLRAFGLHQAGEAVEAMKLYQGLDTPRAQTNLALLHIGQGELAAARALLSRVREEAPELEEARLALERLDRLEGKVLAPASPGEAAPAEPAPPPPPPWPATGLARRLARLKAAGLPSDLLPALPTPADWQAVWDAGLAASPQDDLSDPLRASLAAVSATDLEGRAVSSFWETLLWLDMVIAFLALLAFFTSFGRRELESTRRGKLGWALGALLPGAGRQYWLLGTPLLAVFVYQVFGAWVMSLSHGAGSNLLDSIAVADLTPYFGAYLAPPEPLQAWLDSLCAHWWVLLPINVVFVAIAERVSADPAGPFVRVHGMQRASWRR